MKIPDYFRVGGQLIKVEFPQKTEDDKLGCCCVAEGIIKIAKTFNGKEQSESSQQNTFFHEVVHCILDTMGRGDLSGDEPFVNTFASFLNEAYFSSGYYEKGIENQKG